MPKLVIFTGAGISADSGIQTFRDANGLWENHNIDEVCNAYTWETNFELVHRFYNERRVRLKDAEPNEAHRMVARLQEKYNAQIFTQNIDDLHERGGATKVYHIHGNLKRMRCMACQHRWEIGYEAFEPGVSRCPNVRNETPCASRRVKPDVVFFYEGAPLYTLKDHAIESLKAEDMLLVIGTSGKVVDIGDEARQCKAQTILSNLESTTETWRSDQPVAEDRFFDHVLHGRAAQIAGDLEKMVERLLV